MGWSVAGLADLNGDQQAEFMAGARFADPNGFLEAGSVYIWSGLDGSLIFQKNGSTGDEFGVAVANGGDINADGKTDFIVGAWNADPGGVENAGSAYVYSGSTGSLLYQTNGTGRYDGFGNSVAGIGDVNGDTVADFAVGAPQASPAGLSSAGSAFVYSGADRALLFQKNGTVEGDRLGFSVAGGGDVNGDGQNDFVVSAPNADPEGLDAAGSVFVFSGATGNVLLKKTGTFPYQVFGWRVGGTGDLNSDGFDDVIIGAPLAPPGLNRPGSAFVYSLACRASRGDLNGDELFSASDIVLMLKCVFSTSGNCSLCLTDVSCNGTLNAVDVVVLLNAVFLEDPIDCSP